MSDIEKDMDTLESVDEVTAENENVAEDAEETEITEVASEEQLKINELAEQLNQEKDKCLRIAAEYDNFRKRSIQDKLSAAADASSKVIIEFLSVIDNFERALNSETTDENFKKGVEMIFNQYTAILQKLGVEEIEALNMPFDPNYHNAVNQVQDENFGENTVCQVFQKGYKMGSKVIRCAMVVVANP